MAKRDKGRFAKRTEEPPEEAVPPPLTATEAAPEPSPEPEPPAREPEPAKTTTEDAVEPVYDYSSKQARWRRGSRQ